jgi:predicted negative regulator of RcsB-dependent stress response
VLTPKIKAALIMAVLITVAAFGALAVRGYNEQQRNIGDLRASVRYEQVLTATATAQKDSAVAALARASTKATQAARTLASLRDSIAVTDATPPDSEVTVKARVIQACDLVQRTCAEERLAASYALTASDSLIRTLRRDNAQLRQSLEAATAALPRASWKAGVLGGAIGYGACRVLR